MIGELASIFQRVATMITHQEEMIQRIDQDLDSSMAHIREGVKKFMNECILRTISLLSVGCRVGYRGVCSLIYAAFMVCARLFFIQDRENC